MDYNTAAVTSGLLHRSQAAALSGGTSAVSTADPFGAIIEAMIAQMLENNPGETPEALLSKAFGRAQQENDPLIAGSSAMMNVLPCDMLSLLTAQVLSSGELPQESLISTLSGSQGTTSSALQSIATPTAETALPTTSFLAAATALSGMGADTAAVLPSVEASSYDTGSDTGGEWQSYGHSFQQVIQSVKQQLKDKAGETPVEPLSIDQLQSNVRSTSLEALIAQKTEAAAEAPLLNQVSEGIREHLSLGDSEFTLKLKPESLGEITVRLVKAGEKMTLEIITASSHTARLINSDLATLQDAVKPMQVEVHEAVTAHSAQQWDMSGHSFAGQQFGSGQHPAPSHSENHFSAMLGGEDADAEQSGQTAVSSILSPDSGLSIYI